MALAYTDDIYLLFALKKMVVIQIGDIGWEQRFTAKCWVGYSLLFQPLTD